MLQKSLFVVSMVSLLSLEAQAAQNYTESSQVSTSPSCGTSHHRPMRIAMRHIEPNGIGYNQGYSTLECFFSPSSP